MSFVEDLKYDTLYLFFREVHTPETWFKGEEKGRLPETNRAKCHRRMDARGRTGTLGNQTVWGKVS